MVFTVGVMPAVVTSTLLCWC